ncbi:MAG: hypothetical protein ACRD2P_15580 [Terriglobia bacterium]
MTYYRLDGILMCAAVALACSACGRRYEPVPAGGLAVKEPDGQYMVVTARGRSNEIPATALQRLSSARTPSIRLDTLKVDFRSEGDKVIATVYALTVPHGNPHRYEDPYKPLLGVHSARLGQAIQLKELAKLGFVPITYKVTSARLPAGSQPTLVTKAPSIEIRLLDENREMCKVVLHNKSQKNVVAFALVRNEGNGGRPKEMIASFDPDRPLIPAGTTYAREFPPASSTILAAVLFADGSHEGDSGVAATLYATRLGGETEERRADPLIRRIIADRTLDHTAKISHIRSALSGLSTAPEGPTLRLMQKSFPGLPSATLRKELGRGLDQGVRNLWSSLYEFQHQNAVYPPPKTHPPIERWWPPQGLGPSR